MEYLQWRHHLSARPAKPAPPPPIYWEVQWGTQRQRLPAPKAPAFPPPSSHHFKWYFRLPIVPKTPGLVLVSHPTAMHPVPCVSKQFSDPPTFCHLGDPPNPQLMLGIQHLGQRHIKCKANRQSWAPVELRKYGQARKGRRG